MVGSAVIDEGSAVVAARRSGGTQLSCNRMKTAGRLFPRPRSGAPSPACRSPVW